MQSKTAKVSQIISVYLCRFLFLKVKLQFFRKCTRNEVVIMAKAGQTLYDSRFEHDACGIGAVVNIKGKESHKIVDDALKIVERLEHRAGKDASGETGDGVGIMVNVSHSFFEPECKSLGINLPEKGDYGVGMFFFPQEKLSLLRKAWSF